MVMAVSELEAMSDPNELTLPDLYRPLMRLHEIYAENSVQLMRCNEKVGDIRLKLAEHDRRFDRLDQRLEALEGLRIGERFDGIDERFDGIDERFDGIDERFDGIDERFGNVENRFVEVLLLLQEIRDKPASS
jgi:hypothetical protein